MLRQTLIGALLLLAPCAVAASAQDIQQQTIRINGGPVDGPISVLPPGRQAKTGTSRLRLTAR